MKGSSPLRTEKQVAVGAGDSHSDGHDVFLSYSRRDSDFVRRLYDRLVEREEDVYIDWDDVPSWSPDWQAELYAAIESADTFLLVLSPDSVKSVNVKREVDHALEQGKRIKPLQAADVDSSELPEGVRKPQWIDFRNAREFDDAFAALLETLNTDVDWRRNHTRFLLRANDWETRARDRSLLLGRSDLHDAQEWLEGQAGKEPPPTELQLQYIAASRKATARRRRITFGAVLTAFAITAALAVVAFIQRQHAIHQSHSAQSRALAASSLLALSDDPELSLLLARQAVQEQDTPQALQALRSALANSHVRRTMRVPNVALGWAGFTPDSRKVVVAGGTGPSYVFDVRSGRLAKTLYTFQYKRPVVKSQLSAYGTRLLLLPNIGAPVVLDVSGSSKPVKLIDPTDSWFSDAAISSDGRTAVAATLHSRKARLFDTRTGRILGTWPGHSGRVALGPDGTFVALTGGGSVTTYVAATGARLPTIPFPNAGYPSIVFSPDDYLFVATNTGVSAWNPATGRFVAAMQGLPRSFRTAAWPLAFSRSGRSVAGVSSAGQLFVWDARTGSVRAHIVPPAHTGFSAAALSPDGRYVVTTGSDGIARLWSTRDATMLTEFRGVVGGVTSAAFSPDGKQVLTAGEDGTARIWDPGLNLPVERRRFPLPEFGTGGALGVRWGDLFVVGDTNVPVFDLRSGRRAFQVRLPRPAWDVTLAARAPVMAVTYEHAPVEVWDLPRRRRLWSLPGTAHVVPRDKSVVQGTVIGRDGRRVLVAVGDTLTVWDVRTRTRLGRLRDHVGGEFRASASAFSPDGHLLATVRTDGVIVLWRADDGRVIAREHAERSPGFNASVPVPPAFNADGSLVVAAGNWDRGPGVWRTSDGRLVSKLTQSFNKVAFSPTEPLLVTDGGLVWDAESGRLLLTLHDPTTLLDAAFSSDGLRIVGEGEIPSSTDSTREIFHCDVCGSLTRLMQLAGQRITRSFTAAERDRYLR